MLLLPSPRKTIVSHLKHEHVVNRTGMKMKGNNNLPASQNDIIKDRSVIKIRHQPCVPVPVHCGF